MKSLTRLKWLAVLFAALFVLGGCLDDDDDEEAPEPPPDIEGDMRGFHAVTDLQREVDILVGGATRDTAAANFTVGFDGSDDGMERGTGFETVEAQQGEDLAVNIAPHFDVDGDTVVGGEVGGNAAVDQTQIVGGGEQSFFAIGALGQTAQATAMGALNDDFNAELPETDITEDWDERDFLTGYLDPNDGLMPYDNLADILVEAEVIEDEDDLAEASAVAALQELGGYDKSDFIDEYVDGDSLTDDAPGNLTDHLVAQNAAPAIPGLAGFVLGETACKDLEAIVAAEEERVEALAEDDDDIDFEDVEDDIFTEDEFFADDIGGNLALFEAVFGATGIGVAESNDVTVDPGSGSAAIRAGHLAASAGAVDVYVTGPNTEVDNPDVDPKFEDISFGSFTDFREIRLTSDTPRIHITEAGTNDVLYTYLVDKDNIDGQVVNAFAMDNFANPGDVTPLVAQAMIDDEDLPVTPLLVDNSGEIRFAHANPDVDELAVSYRAEDVDGNRFGPRVEVGVLEYGDYTGYLRFFSEFDDEDAVYDIEARDEAGVDQAAVIGIDEFEITPGVAETGIVIDDGGPSLLETESDIPNTDNSDETGNVTIRAINAADGQGDVDVSISSNDSDGTASFDDVAFEELTDYAGIAFEQDMNCDVAESEEFTLSLEGMDEADDRDMDLYDGATYSAIAIPEDPEDDDNEPFLWILEDR